MGDQMSGLWQESRRAHITVEVNKPVDWKHSSGVKQQDPFCVTSCLSEAWREWGFPSHPRPQHEEEEGR